MESIESVQEAFGATYEIERQIGLGGAARVLLARDVKHGRNVAIKLLLPNVAANLGVGRFLQEIQFAARLTHPHIMPLLDSGYAGGLPFYVMPYVEGETVRQRLDRAGRLSIDDSVRFIGQIADALEYAHAAGIIHRDIKPDNVLLMSSHALVLDFGVGRAIAAASENTESSVTIEGMIVGTPAYLSPEQASGEITIDGRTDEYSLALMLFEMLSGETPFRGPTPQAVIAQRFTRAAPPLTSLRSDTPEHVSAAVARALSFEPHERFASVAEFGQALADRYLPSLGTSREAPSVAVLPFVNLSGAADDEYFADGITDAVMHALGRRRTLRVAARSSSYALRGRSDDIKAVGDRLNVRTIVEGSIRRSGQRVRISAALVNVADGFQVWADQFDRELNDVFAIQDEISAAIAQSLEGALGVNADVVVASAKPQSVEAYERYLRGRYFWNKRTEDALVEAAQQFERAIALDPGFALAHAGLADVFAVLGTYGARPPRDVFPAARESAQCALAVDPSLGEAHATLGLVHAVLDRDWDEAEAAFRRAITLAPAYATARQWLAVSVFAPLGRTDDAIAALEDARALDPLSLTIGSSLGIVNALGRRHDEAIASHQQVVTLEPGFGIGWFFLGQALLGAGRASEAVTALDRAAQLAGATPEIIAVGACARCAAGDGLAGERALETLTNLRSRRYVASSLLAQVAIALGRYDDSFIWLDEAIAAADPETLYLNVRAAYDPLRSLPPFAATVERAGLVR